VPLPDWPGAIGDVISCTAGDRGEPAKLVMFTDWIVTVPPLDMVTVSVPGPVPPGTTSAADWTFATCEAAPECIIPVAYVYRNAPATTVITIRIIVAIIGDIAFLRVELALRCTDRGAPRAMDFITPSYAEAI